MARWSRSVEGNVDQLGSGLTVLEPIRDHPKGECLDLGLSFVSCIALFAGSVIPSQVLRLQAGVLGDASEHLRSHLLAIVKSKGEVGPPLSRKRAVGTRLALDGPAYLEERRQHA